MDRSKSLERRRQRGSHPKVRSTTQCRDMTTTPLGVPGFADDRHSDRAIRFLERACQLVAATGAVGKHGLHRVLTGLQRQRQGTRAIPVLDMRRMDMGGKRVAIDVDGKVTLAALDRLAGIVAAFLAASFDRRHALTVDDGRTRVRTTPRPEPFERGKTGANLLQHPDRDHA